MPLATFKLFLQLLNTGTRAKCDQKTTIKRAVCFPDACRPLTASVLVALCPH